MIAAAAVTAVAAVTAAAAVAAVIAVIAAAAMTAVGHATVCERNWWQVCGASDLNGCHTEVTHTVRFQLRVFIEYSLAALIGSALIINTLIINTLHIS